MKKKRFTTGLTTFFLLAAVMLFGLAGCGKTEEPSTEAPEYLAAYEKYVQSVLDTNYHGEFAEYMQITGATEAQASSMNEAHAVALAKELAQLYAIELKQLPAEIGDKLTDICAKIYKSTGYSVSKVENVGETVYVTVTVQPVDFVEAASKEVSKYTEEFNDRAKAGEFEQMTESQYENEYAKGMLKVLETAAGKVSYQPEKTYRIEIQYNSETGVNYIADEDLEAIDQIILAD